MVSLFRNGVVRFESVMKLRTALDDLGKMEGITEKEKGTHLLTSGGSRKLAQGRLKIYNGQALISAALFYFIFKAMHAHFWFV